VTLVGLSATDAICSGTSRLRCDFAELDANATATVNITVRAAASGNFLSQVTLASLNDTNPANDSGQVALDISGAVSAPAPAAGGGSGGGGGRLEWLMLAACALLAAARLKKAANPSRFAALAD